MALILNKANAQYAFRENTSTSHDTMEEIGLSTFYVKFKANEVSSDQVICGFQRSTGFARGFELAIVNGELIARSQSGSARTIVAGSISEDVWYTGVAVLGGAAANGSNISLNDFPAVSGALGEVVGTTLDRFVIGASTHNAAAVNCFGGEIAHVYWWHRKLTTEEVNSLKGGAHPNTVTGAAFAYDLISDATGSGSDATTLTLVPDPIASPDTAPTFNTTSPLSGTKGTVSVELTPDTTGLPYTETETVRLFVWNLDGSLCHTALATTVDSTVTVSSTNIQPATTYIVGVVNGAWDKTAFYTAESEG